ncbi:MAG: L-seryl-tRNA(Sec) selenium transferase [Acidobacteriota bacterium]|nr:L-seryl-tRNA(Sec) selenium transferase [Acidobacteriota bacterium]
MTTPRILPSIERLRQRPAVRGLETDYGRDAVLAVLRTVVSDLRKELHGTTSPRITTSEAAIETIEARTAAHLTADFTPSLREVINATGVIVHTNLGRAPLSAAAAARVAEVATGYTHLGYVITAGARGARHVHAERLLTRLTGAQAAIVVNNNAAAVLLSLAALAQGQEVLVSRGELVEIGGGFRIPDIMRQSGARLREVGTTNKTRIADFAAAVGAHTGLILRVHPSNFRIQGFTEQPRLPELVALGRRFSIPVLEDLGSGNLSENQPIGGVIEPSVIASVKAGINACCFSGDKLFGGPQSGIVVGEETTITRLRTHPLMRALRVDKLTYAALDMTLLEYARGRSRTNVPVVRMLNTPLETLDRRARRLAERLADHSLFGVEVIDGVSTVGGGGAPESALPTRLTRLRPRRGSASRLESRLRTLRPAIVARIEADSVVLDLRTVPSDDDDRLTAALIRLGQSASS